MILNFESIEKVEIETLYGKSLFRIVKQGESEIAPEFTLKNLSNQNKITVRFIYFK